MLKKMQKQYAEKPVRFLLVPCNQFGNQEPKENSVIKAYAEKFVDVAKKGAGSNVIMLAKSNLNGVKCTSSGSSACSPDSAECCPANDGVYDYLLSATAPGNIGWNWDKIITGPDGQPYSGETIFVGGDLDKKLSDVIDRQLAMTAMEMPTLPSSGGMVVMVWLALAAACAAFFLAMYRRSRWNREPDRQDMLSGYSYIAA